MPRPPLVELIVIYISSIQLPKTKAMAGLTNAQERFKTMNTVICQFCTCATVQYFEMNARTAAAAAVCVWYCGCNVAVMI